VPQEIVFYTNPMSRGRIVRWMLEEVGEPYETRVLSFGPEMKTPEFLALNVMGKVPTIRHAETVVSETGAICAYLADAFPQAGLAPDTADRGDYYRRMFFMAGPGEAAAIDRALNLDITLEQRRGWYGSADSVLDALERAVSDREFIAGESFSAADVYCGAQIGMGMHFGAIEKRPAFVRYWNGLSSREAYITATALDDELMPEGR
jgi:glutathione S-transferase